MNRRSFLGGAAALRQPLRISDCRCVSTSRRSTLRLRALHLPGKSGQAARADAFRDLSSGLKVTNLKTIWRFVDPDSDRPTFSSSSRRIKDSSGGERERSRAKPRLPCLALRISATLWSAKIRCRWSITGSRCMCTASIAPAQSWARQSPVSIRRSGIFAAKRSAFRSISFWADQRCARRARLLSRRECPHR